MRTYACAENMRLRPHLFRTYGRKYDYSAYYGRKLLAYAKKSAYAFSVEYADVSTCIVQIIRYSWKL